MQIDRNLLGTDFVHSNLDSVCVCQSVLKPSFFAVSGIAYRDAGGQSGRRLILPPPLGFRSGLSVVRGS